MSLMVEILRSTITTSNVLTALMSKDLAMKTFLISYNFFQRLLNADKEIDITSIEGSHEVKTLYIHIPFCRKPCKFCCFLRFRYNEDYYRKTTIGRLL